jgi:hypothetical protein
MIIQAKPKYYLFDIQMPEEELQNMVRYEKVKEKDKGRGGFIGVEDGMAWVKIKINNGIYALPCIFIEEDKT